MQTDELLKKLERLASALEALRTYQPEGHVLDPYLELSSVVKRQAGDALVDIGALKVVNGAALYIGVKREE